MNKEIIYVSDFFVNEIVGGAELNDDELISLLSENGYKVNKLKSRNVTIDFLRKNHDSFFIISNFIQLHRDCKDYLMDLNYVIYEHDHKYLKKRNPSFYKNFKAPMHEIVNYFFYKNAVKVICQSSYHKNIIQDNLKLDNILNISGNLWSVKTLERIRELSKNEKQKKCSILDSNIMHKNTAGAVKFCSSKKLEYELIKGNYDYFLNSMSRNEKFVFFPKSPETLSRVVVEARMLGCSVVTNQMVGATYEDWFKFKGEELINYFFDKRIEIFDTLRDIIDSSEPKTKRPLVSIISTFYKAEEFLHGFMEDITSQTIFEDCELIVIDSGSPAKEKDIMNDYCKKYPNIRYIRYDEVFPPTMGHNIAMTLCNSKYITWAMIDDRKSPDFLEILYNGLKYNPQIDLVYGNCLVTSVKNEKLSDTKSTTFSEHSLRQFSRENMIKCLPGPMPMWTTRMIDKVGFFNDVDCDFCDDWELWLRSVDQGCVFKKINKTVGLYLEGGRSQMDNNLDQRKEEARLFFKYKHIFGRNYQIYYSYFKQFSELDNG